MLENPQKLINIKENSNPDFIENSEQVPDAIYIPFLNRYNNLNELLLSLTWFKRNIIVLISSEDEITKIDTKGNYQVNFINCLKFEETNKILNLKTFKDARPYKAIQEWDLPIKRNFALVHAIQNSFQRILLIDDDIQGITIKVINRGIETLESNNITGCLVKDFPDTSVVGHIEQKYGEPYFPFLSGNFLFICPNRTDGFFPLIYNEDWLFMIPSIIQNKISAVDVIYQKGYDPFDNISKVKLQEFGEVIAEGLFELISQKRFDDRLNKQFWDEYLDYRRSYVSGLLKEVETKFIPLLKESLRINKSIKAKDCIDFIIDWEEDIIVFNKIKNNESKKG